MPEDADLEEKEILKPILKYREFNRFYMSERSNIRNKISWLRDIDSNNDFYIAYAHPFTKLGVHEIHFRHFPESKTDAFLFAHEIFHLVRIEDNKTPLMRCVERYMEHTTALSSLLEDPIVDSILKTRYNFNLRPFYMHVIEKAKKQFGGEYADEFDRLRDGWIHAGWVLKWRLMDDKSAIKSWKRFNKKYESVREKASRISLDTITLVDNIGVDTIEKQAMIINKLLHDNNLKEMISLA